MIEKMTGKNKKYKTQFLLDKLKSYHADGYSIKTSSMAVLDNTVLSRLTFRFGSWDNVLVAAGFNPEEHRGDHLTDSHAGKLFENISYKIYEEINPDYLPDYCYKTVSGKRLLPDLYDPITNNWLDFKISSYSSSITGSIKKYKNYANKLIFICLKDTRRSPEDKVEYINIFDVIDANPQLEKYREDLNKIVKYHKKSKKTDLAIWNTKWNKELVLSEIKLLTNEQLNKKWLAKNYIALYRNSAIFFDTFEKALIAAGKNPADCWEQRKPYTKEEIIAFIKNAYLNDPASIKDVKIKIDNSGLRDGAQRLFGSWGKAVEAAGISYEKIKNIQTRIYTKKPQNS